MNFFVSLLVLLSIGGNVCLPSHVAVRVKRSISDQCCVSSKLNVAAQKANKGREFFRELSTGADAYKQVNPDNMCNLIHFLVQQASLSNKSVTFTKGMFVVFDSTNQIFGQLMKAKDEQKSGDGAKHAGYFKRLKHMSAQAISKLFESSKDKSELIESDTFIYVRGDESSHYHGERGSKGARTQDYPAYGVDIPGACMPSGFGHILFGRLPAIQTRGKYAGERVYIKPELFGIRELQEFVQHAKSYFDHVSRRYVCQLKEVQKEAGCSSEAAFRENTDKKLLEQWRAILLTIPSISNVEELYMSNATKYGLSEIDRQAKELEAAGEQKKVGAFHRQMLEQYGQDDISVRKGREIIFTREGLMSSPLACDMFSRMTKC